MQKAFSSLVYKYSEQAKKQHIILNIYKKIMALRFIKCLIRREVIIFYVVFFVLR